MKPNQLIDLLDGQRKHLALFYENENYARQLENRFIRNGLVRGEQCILTTHKDDVHLIEKSMEEYSIDVPYYKEKGLLHVVKITDPRQDRDGFTQGIENLKNIILADKAPPIRLVSRFIREVETEDDARANMFVERTIHSQFENYNGTFICPYPVEKVPLQIRGEWLINHLCEHHIAIFAPLNGEGIAIPMRD